MASTVNIEKKVDGSTLTALVSGRVDTTTAPTLESELQASIGDVESLVLDLTGLEYISSAGLRVLLSTLKIMKKKGGMVIKNVSEEVMEVFEVTGFADIFTIE